jgi:CspA family cold shock protein
MAERVRGTIKWFNPEKRYGFIQRTDGLSDVFVHMSDFRSQADAHWVRERVAVEFEVVQAPKGPRAVDVVMPAQ